MQNTILLILLFGLLIFLSKNWSNYDIDKRLIICAIVLNFMVWLAYTQRLIS